MTQVFAIIGTISITNHLPQGDVCETHRQAMTYQVRVEGATSRDDARRKISGQRLEDGSQLGDTVVSLATDGDGINTQGWDVSVDGEPIWDRQQAQDWQKLVDSNSMAQRVFMKIETVLD
jgi:hypothetical protein